MRRILNSLLIGGVSLSIISCDSSEDETGKPKVVTTIAMIADVARQIAGDDLEVENIIGEGVDPHLFNPTSTDVKKLQSADLILYNGLYLEGKMIETFKRFDKAGIPVHAVAEELGNEDNYLIDDGDHSDPHVWMDVSGWIKVTDEITAALKEVAPGLSDKFDERAVAYKEELKKLDEYAKTSIASIPENQRVLVTAHDAFNYMARAYGLEVRGIQGISTESEAGLKDINELVDYLIEKNIPAVFVETSVSDKSVEALIEGAKSRGHKVEIGGELFSDAMGTAGTYEGTYIGMIDHNVTTITRALGGDAPEKGLNGKLN